MTHYPILITSDIVCPWCYIGHTRLSKAIDAHKAKHPNDTFHLRYLPFYLNPPPHLNSNDMPAFPVKSVNKREMYASKFGPERGKQIEERIIATAAGEGLKFSFGGNTGISRNGHRLVYYGQTHGGEEGQNSVMLGLWKRYYEREVDITTLETLTEVGVEAGLGTAEEIREYLESGRDGVEVDKLAEEQRMNGISGVPNYVLMDTWEVSGAQEPTVFLQLFQRWKDMEAKGQVKGVEQETTKANGASACL
ncbi:hypothetical protein PMZ80_003823 [Knufia obscura]|uniref:DSBA-like thioredoxin domain-containing protein n=2 Tax=Knufia TaxID=430999 RepID=A0AAN8EXB4_9EURO|nr:hypothetical protein PMZ80_003823 [Knufia obscura]KAK5958260.1 hypothetical protein OHC33_000102 [Knufia fluminis]